MRRETSWKSISCEYFPGFVFVETKIKKKQTKKEK